MSLNSAGLKVRADRRPRCVISQPLYEQAQKGFGEFNLWQTFHTCLQPHLQRAENFRWSLVSFFPLLANINMNYSAGRQQGAPTAPYDVPFSYFEDFICK